MFFDIQWQQFLKFYVSMISALQLWFSLGWLLSVYALWHTQSEGDWNLQKQTEWIFLDINCIE